MGRRLRRRAAVLALVVCAALPLAGCRYHISRLDLNRAVTRAHFEAILLGEHDRRDVLAYLGPPDRVLYTPSELIFDYEAARHRGNDFSFFLPTYFVGSGPFFLLRIPRLFFSGFEEPDEFDETTGERASRRATQFGLGLIPFTRGEDLLIVRGRQVRRDRLRVVMDRETLATRAKALRLASGEYEQHTITDRMLLQTD